MEENESIIKQNNGKFELSNALMWCETTLQYAYHLSNNYTTIEEMRHDLKQKLLAYESNKMITMDHLIQNPTVHFNPFIKDCYKFLQTV